MESTIFDEDCASHTSSSINQLITQVISAFFRSSQSASRSYSPTSSLNERASTSRVHILSRLMGTPFIMRQP